MIIKRFFVERLAYKNEQNNRKNNSENYLSARVIVVSPILESGELYLDKGSQDGIKKGQAVTYHGFLVGVVNGVKENICSFLPINSPRISIPVSLLSSGVSGILKSDLNGLSVEQIPIDQKISAGDKIITNSRWFESRNCCR